MSSSSGEEDAVPLDGGAAPVASAPTGTVSASVPGDEATDDSTSPRGAAAPIRPPSKGGSSGKKKANRNHKRFLFPFKTLILVMPACVFQFEKVLPNW
jgi:hypothetical protein